MAFGKAGWRKLRRRNSRVPIQPPHNQHTNTQLGSDETDAPKDLLTPKATHPNRRQILLLHLLSPVDVRRHKRQVVSATHHLNRTLPPRQATSRQDRRV
ncbi:hypothetical protein LINPERHAP2_LOCUS14545 [Linum perenne]